MTSRAPWLAVAAVLALTACSGTSKHTVVAPLPTVSAAPAATTVAPVAVPAAARVHDAFGAAAFVRFYFGRVNVAYNMADATGLAALTDEKCAPCQEYVRAARDLASKGEQMRGLAARVLAAESPPEQNGYVAVDVLLDSPARSLVSVRGQVVKRLAPAPRVHLAVFLKHVPAGWLVRTIETAR